ncbi:MAG TPA: hypothetical protein VGW34_06430 [Allosphingosinicella sp.]|nr:hypothetical protein [Allosphingosinicella sp.]
MQWKTINVGVDVIADADTNAEDGVGFHLEPHSNSSDYFRDGKMIFPEGPDHYRVSFFLRDRTGNGSQGLQLRFPDEPRDAIWIGTRCPPSDPGPGGSGSPDIQPLEIDTAKKKLTIDNFNRDQATLAYMLRFRTREGASVPYDPIIENGGGGRGSS